MYFSLHSFPSLISISLLERGVNNQLNRGQKLAQHNPSFPSRQQQAQDGFGANFVHKSVAPRACKDLIKLAKGFIEVLERSKRKESQKCTKIKFGKSPSRVPKPTLKVGDYSTPVITNF